LFLKRQTLDFYQRYPTKHEFSVGMTRFNKNKENFESIISLLISRQHNHSNYYPSKFQYGQVLTVRNKTN